MKVARLLNEISIYDLSTYDGYVLVLFLLVFCMRRVTTGCSKAISAPFMYPFRHATKGVFGVQIDGDVKKRIRVEFVVLLESGF